MKSGFYPKIALGSIKKNKQLYIPYILTCSGMTMMFYIIHHLAAMPALDNMSGGSSTKTMLGFGVWVIAIFALIFLFYTNSFLMRRRQKEFGIYNILGMGKNNLSKVYAFETLFVYIISVVSGLFLGIALSKAAELGLVRALGGKITYDFTVNGEVIADTAAVFGIIFILLFLKGISSLKRLNSVNLLKSDNVGDRPPKANYLLGILGIILLAGAYYISVTIKNPLAALSWFFIAVIMVITATYMIFISGSVMLCRVLQKNKKYYYRKNHFISISSMVYRMKRNGTGLASICILSTMVLVMMLGTGCLFFGAEDTLNARYPKDIAVYTEFNPNEKGKEYSDEKVERITSEVDKIIASHGANIKNAVKYTQATVTGMLSDGKLTVNPDNVNMADTQTMKNVSNIHIMSLNEYNSCMKQNETLGENEVLIYCLRRDYNDSEIALHDGTVLKVKKHVDKVISDSSVADLLPSVYIITDNPEKIFNSLNGELSNENYFCKPKMCYAFDADLSAKEKISLSADIREAVRTLDYSGEGGFCSYSIESREEERADFYGSYAGIFYLGIILSAVFLIATVLIIYYKQVTEGYEDKGRFRIMQNVGMTKSDIRKSINSQMLTVFFMPLMTAILHLCFAFPIIKKLLALFSFTNIRLMVITTLITVSVFALFYVIIYKITSNVYFGIVSDKDPTE